MRQCMLRVRTRSVYIYETVAQTYHKNVNQGIFENILKNAEKNPLAIQTSMDPN